MDLHFACLVPSHYIFQHRLQSMPQHHLWTSVTWKSLMVLSQLPGTRSLHISVSIPEQASIHPHPGPSVWLLDSFLWVVCLPSRWVTLRPPCSTWLGCAIFVGARKERVRKHYPYFYLTKLCHLERRKINVETLSLLLFEIEKLIAYYQVIQSGW